MIPFRLPVTEAIYVTNEIPTVLPDTGYAVFQRCQSRRQWNGTEVRCEKEGCLNGKHWGLAGQMPNRTAIVWWEEKNDE